MAEHQIRRRSLLALGDQDNPASATPATVDVQFNSSILDDARNLHGLDFIVFSNSFWISGNAQSRFTEPALIEVSQDLNPNGMADDPWFLMVPNILPGQFRAVEPRAILFHDAAQLCREFADLAFG